MSVRNEESFLAEAIDSILNQTYPFFEFLIVDDASTDQTLAILEKYSKKDKRIKIFINEKQKGLTKNLNFLIAKAKGKYIARMDGNDISYLERFKKQVDFLETHLNITVLGTNYYRIDEKNNTFAESNLPTDSTNMTRGLKGINPLCHVSVMMRTDDLRNVGGYNSVQRYAQDYDLWLRLTTKGYLLANLPDKLVKIRFIKERMNKPYLENNKVLLMIQIMLKHPSFFVSLPFLFSFFKNILFFFIILPFKRLIKTICIALFGKRRTEFGLSILRQTEGHFLKKILHGGMWIFLLKFTGRGFGMIRTIILARLLVPYDFGLFGILLLVLSILETFGETGFHTALIQKKENVDSYINTAWTVQLVRSIMIALVLFATSSLIADFFQEPRVKMLIQVIGIAVIIKGTSNLSTMYFRKNLEFDKLFAYEFAAVVMDMVVAIAAAIIFHNVWALIFGLLARNATFSFMSYLLFPYRPRLRFDYTKAKELFGFGKWVLGANILTFFILQGDDLFISKFLGVTALGFYQLAFRFANLAATEIANVLTQVTFPVYSKLQLDIPRLRKGFLQTMDTSLSISLPLSVAIFILSKQFVLLFLGQNWLPIVPVMRILVFAGLLRSIIESSRPLFMAVGIPKLEFWMNFTRFIVIVVTIYPLTKTYAISGTAISVLLGLIIALPFWIYTSSKIICNKYLVLFKLILPSILGSLIMAGVLIFLLQIITQVTIFFFIILSLIGLIVYGTVLLYLWRSYNIGPLANLYHVLTLITDKN